MFRRLGSWLVLLQVAALVASATATPTPTCRSVPNWFHGSSSSSSTSTAAWTAGVIHQLRGGGELHEPETLEEVEDLIQQAAMNGKLVVIDFTASWCGPCKMIAPLFQEMAETMGDDVVFLKVDVDENPDTAAKFSVSAMPTFLFVKQGEVLDRLMGANASRLQELIQEHM